MEAQPTDSGHDAADVRTMNGQLATLLGNHSWNLQATKTCTDLVKREELLDAAIAKNAAVCQTCEKIFRIVGPLIDGDGRSLKFVIKPGQSYKGLDIGAEEGGHPSASYLPESDPEYDGPVSTASTPSTTRDPRPRPCNSSTGATQENRSDRKVHSVSETSVIDKPVGNLLIVIPESVIESLTDTTDDDCYATKVLANTRALLCSIEKEQNKFWKAEGDLHVSRQAVQGNLLEVGKSLIKAGQHQQIDITNQQKRLDKLSTLVTGTPSEADIEQLVARLTELEERGPSVHGQTNRLEAQQYETPRTTPGRQLQQMFGTTPSGNAADKSTRKPEQRNESPLKRQRIDSSELQTISLGFDQPVYSRRDTQSKQLPSGRNNHHFSLS